MPYCRYCDKEYPEPFEECPVCHHLLLPARPQWRPYDPAGPLVEVATVHGPLPAEVVRGKLEVNGIPAVIQHESAGGIYGVIVDGLGAEHILVPADLATEAREVLDLPDELDEEDELDEAEDIDKD